ncbi:hypothetical protein ACE6H2_023885 [Prunus campanulata]
MNYFVLLKTKKVVATYGYMSSKCEIDGFYSLKSNIYSFGGLMLEIVSEKRNIGFTHCFFLFLLLSKHNDFELLINSFRHGCYTQKAVVRLFHHVGLLCVQCNPGDRPSMLVTVKGISMNSKSCFKFGAKIHEVPNCLRKDLLKCHCNVHVL